MYDTSVIERMLLGIDIPQMTLAIQKPKMDGIADLDTVLARKLKNCGVDQHIHPKMRIAVAVGSRGIANIALIVKCVLDYVKSLGAEPFIIPAMGSHGGGTSEGQCAVLADYGITEASMGVFIDASMDTEIIGYIGDVPLHMAKSALKADGVILCARIKPHTDFRGEHESGLLKMIAIGLGKHSGAIALHGRGFENMENSICMAAENAIKKKLIHLGIATVENELHETSWIECVPPEEFVETDKKALVMSRSLIGAIPFCNLDAVLLGEMGKDISGNGFDTNIVDRFYFKGELVQNGPRPRYLLISDLTGLSHGNASGIGMSDIITKRAYKKIDYAKTYINCITARGIRGASIPVVMKDDATAVKLCMMLCGKNYDQIRMVCLKNTLESTKLYITPALMSECGEHVKILDKILAQKNGYYQF